MTHRHGQHRLGASHTWPRSNRTWCGDRRQVFLGIRMQSISSQQMRCQTLYTSLIVTTVISLLQSRTSTVGYQPTPRPCCRASVNRSSTSLNNPWLGKRPVTTAGALGFSGTQAAWQRISRENLTKWSRAIAAKPMYLFPDQGLNMKVLLHRIGELWVDGTRD